MLDWTQEELAERAGISGTCLDTIERGLSNAGVSTMRTIQRILEEAGIAFTNGGEPGVKLRRRGARDEGLHPSQLTSENDG